MAQAEALRVEQGDQGRRKRGVPGQGESPLTGGVEGGERPVRSLPAAVQDAQGAAVVQLVQSRVRRAHLGEGRRRVSQAPVEGGTRLGGHRPQPRAGRPRPGRPDGKEVHGQVRGRRLPGGTLNDQPSSRAGWSHTITASNCSHPSWVPPGAWRTGTTMARASGCGPRSLVAGLGSAGLATRWRPSTTKSSTSAVRFSTSSCRWAMSRAASARATDVTPKESQRLPNNLWNVPVLVTLLGCQVQSCRTKYVRHLTSGRVIARGAGRAPGVEPQGVRAAAGAGVVVPYVGPGVVYEQARGYFPQCGMEMPVALVERRELDRL